jgi:hypothetical protein
MMRGEACDGVSGETIAEAAFENEAAQESGWRGGCYFRYEARRPLSNICRAASGAYRSPIMR